MNIGFNALGLKSNTGGVEVYVYNLVKSVLDIDHKNNYFLFIGKNVENVFHDLNYRNLKKIVFPIDTNNSIIRIITENTLLLYVCLFYKINLVQHFCNYLPRFFFIKSLVTVHDLGGFFYNEKFPDYKPMKKYYKYMKANLKFTLKRAHKIIAMSNFTKSEILKYYPNTPQDKILVLTGSLDLRKNNVKNIFADFVQNNFKLKKNYLLSVSVVRPHKNLTFLISVYNKLREKYAIDYDLVLVGGIQLNDTSFLDAINHSPYKDHIYYTNYLDIDYLPFIYKNAYLYIFPSMYEGLGVPLLEAMQYNIPIASSNAASLPEVGGEGCLYFNPKDINNAVDVIYKLLTNKNLYNRIKEKQPDILKKYNWTDRAYSLAKIYEENLN